jgi:hypothetical protein
LGGSCGFGGYLGAAHLIDDASQITVSKIVDAHLQTPKCAPRTQKRVRGSVKIPFEFQSAV